MRRRHGQWTFLMILGIGLGLARAAAADVTIERSSSILVFPKIIADGTRDTIVQIGNTSNQLVLAHCFYVNGALTNPSLPPGPLNPALWQEIDFTIRLTRQQPTQWVASIGRLVDPTDGSCSETKACSQAGFDPGRVPPVVPGFTGELKCVEVDDSGAPLSGNHLLGVANIFENREERLLSDGDVIFSGESSYNAIGVLGEENNGDNVLVLGGGQCSGSGVVCNSDDDCEGSGPCVPEYNACPDTWILNHLADGAPDIVLGEDSSVETELTIVPCTQNFETQIPTTVTIQFLTWNEFESQFSVSTSVTCWGNFRLGDIGARALTFEGQLPDPQGTMYLQTRMRSAGGTPFGMMMVAEEFHVDVPSTVPDISFRRGAAAAVNLHTEGERRTPDLITIPADQLQP